MNTLKTGLTAVIFSATILYGDDSVNEQIKAMQKVSTQERAELMNKLKMQIASMNEEERANTISILRSEMGGQHMHSGIPRASQRMQQMQSTQQGTAMQRRNNTLNTQFPHMGR